MNGIRESFGRIPIWVFGVVVLAALAACTCAVYVEYALGQANSRIPSGSDDHDKAWLAYRSILRVNRVTLGLSAALAVATIFASATAKRPAAA